MGLTGTHLEWSLLFEWIDLISWEETVTLLRNYSLFLIVLTSPVYIELLKWFLLMVSLTDDGHCSRGLGSEKLDGRVVVFPSTSPNELRVNVYDPLRGGARGGIKSN
jgi:hypothetical protein